MFSFTHAAVCTLLAVQTQVDLAALTPDHGPEARAVGRTAAVAFARVAERYMPWGDPNSVVVPHALLPVQLQLAAGTLQAAALVALVGGLVRAAAGVALLADQGTVHPLPTHPGAIEVANAS